MRVVLLVFAVTLGTFASQAPSTLAIVGATLVDPAAGSELADSVVLVRDGAFVAVGPSGRVVVPAGATTVDAKGKWLIPGLVDAHVHFFQSGGLYTRPDVVDLREVVPYERETADIDKALTDTFARYLRTGITSAVDVGGPIWNFEVRRKAEATSMAPRIAVAGPLITTFAPPILSALADPPIIHANSPDAARALVRKQAPHTPDFIKIWYIVPPKQSAASLLPVVQATIDESHQLGIPVAVHATELETARAAVSAGADVLVHSVEDREVDAGFIRLLVDRKVIYIPTLGVGGNYGRTFRQQLRFSAREFDMANPGVMATLFDLRTLPAAGLPTWLVKELDNTQPVAAPVIALKNLKLLADAGVTIASGSDAGNIGTLHGVALWREFRLMADAGLTPAQILKSATVNGAALMKREARLGTIAPGKLADAVLLNANPLRDIENASDFHAVIKAGTVFRPNELLRKSPEDVVQQQVNAYNARDIDAFLATYATGAQLHEFQGKSFATGHADLRKAYTALFARAPKLHCRITNRISSGNVVIDREQVTGLPDGKTLQAVAIYEVRDERITRVWFLPPE
jgi:imidazolonepropionase-like amidohydrolase